MLALSQTADHYASATATAPDGSTSEFALSREIIQGLSGPAIVTTQPVSQTVAAGAGVTLTVAANGSAPIHYQWRHNGIDLPGATNVSLTLSNFQAADAGTYTVTVYNHLGSEISAAATLRLASSPLALSDNFTIAVSSAALTGVVQSNNTAATLEVGEPLHAGKPGGKSMWFTWRAAVAGIATFSTAGSDFDTLLGVYQGPAVNALTELASDDDGAGFYNSVVRFNTMSNAVYEIAVDGAGGAAGNIVLQWSLETTSDLYPVITNHPSSQITQPGTNVIFSVSARGNGFSYQWYFRETPIVGATNSTLLVSNVNLAQVGAYYVQVQLGTRTAFSRKAHLQLTRSATVEDVLVADKFIDVALGGKRLRLDPPPSAIVTTGGWLAAAVSRGYSGSQIFSTEGSAKEPDEPNHCGVPGGASQWFSFYADAGGVLALNTDGSTFDTVLAVYTGSGTDLSSLTPVTCDNDSGTNGLTSSLHFTTTPGQTYYIVVDGVNGASGTVVLNYTTEGERQVPSVAITAGPPTNARLTNDAITLSGIAADNSALATVEWRVTNSFGVADWTAASGSNDWTIRATGLTVGANTVEVRAWDTWGNPSPVVSRRYIRLAPLTVSIVGCGSVSSGFLGTSYRESGSMVTVSATPCGNSVFTGWSGEMVTNDWRISFLMPTGLALQANFITNPFTPIKGNYAGLFCDTNVIAQERAGFVTVTTTGKGTYSGRLQIGVKSYGFTGKFNFDGLATNSVRRSSTNAPLRLELNLNLGQSVEWLAGRVLDTNWTADLAAYRAVFHARTNPAPYAGRYTALLPANGLPGTPEGDGCIALAVSAAGAARCIGTLADGTPLNQAATVSREGLWPVYAPLHGGRGSVWSWLFFETNTVLFGTNTAQGDLAGDWRWLKPALSATRYYTNGFTNVLSVIGARYWPPLLNTNGALSFSNGVIVFNGGNLAAPFTNRLIRTQNDRMTSPDTNRLVLTLSRPTGLFSGSVAVPGTGMIAPFKGALFQNADVGVGYALHTNTSGSVWLGPLE